VPCSAAAVSSAAAIFSETALSSAAGGVQEDSPVFALYLLRAQGPCHMLLASENRPCARRAGQGRGEAAAEAGGAHAHAHQVARSASETSRVCQTPRPSSAARWQPRLRARQEPTLMQQLSLHYPLPLPCPPPPPPPSQAQAPIFLQPHSPRPRAGSRRTRLSLRYTCCARKAPVTCCWRSTGAGRQRQKREGHTRTLIK
jgi:hypothetical protein